MVGADVPGSEPDASDRPTIVVHLITTLGQGGAERALSLVVPGPEEAAQRGERHVVVSLAPGGIFADALAERGVDVRNLGLNRGADLLRGSLRLRRLLSQLDPDTTLTWMYHACLLEILARPIRRRGRRLIWVLQSALQSTSSLPLHTRITIRLLASLSRRPTAIAINSHAGEYQHVQFGYRPRRWAHLPNGCDFSVFAPDLITRSSVREELGIREGEDLVLFVGRNHPEKGLDVLLDGFRQFDEVGSTPVALALIGTGTGTQDLRISDGRTTRVLALGERRDVARLLRGADLLVLPSRTEGAPNVVIEAMGSEVPCLVTDVGDNALIVGDTGIVIPPEDAAALRDGLVRFLELSPAQRRTLGVRARSLVVENHELETARAIYRQLWEASCP